ncbi:hypothetical protein DICVIV_09966 [Dictyocaulus viviparus]|uniref:SAM domain-containing protein n=1 Tax=Dictyocaulus viviparus TaxID=29172 RepID=A0A0D8XH64_DICVI|nr:hypothetical protein DICVIV_09966 [Dictyocaulus viviparus]
MVDSQSRLGSAPLFPFEIHGNETDHWRQVLLKIRQEISKEEATLRDLRLVGTCQRKRNWFTDWITRKWRRHSDGPSSSVTTWSMNDVSLWLNSLGLAQYTKEFKSNDIQGYQLVHLERSDMKDLGIHKMAHAERLQSAIAELRRKEMESRSGSRCSRRKGARVSLEHAQVRSTNELPSLSSV